MTIRIPRKHIGFFLPWLCRRGAMLVDDGEVFIVTLAHRRLKKCARP